MATKRAKTEKIDLNPKRVQNPYEHLKRSPGKFDQKVYMEQELCSTNTVKFYKRLYTTQQRSQLHRFDKNIAELRKRGIELKAQNEEYAYLSALRTALNREKEKRRRDGICSARPVTPEDVRRQLRIERRKTLAIAEAEAARKKAEEKLAAAEAAKENPETKDNTDRTAAEQEEAASTEVDNIDQTLSQSLNNTTINEHSQQDEGNDMEEEPESKVIVPKKTHRRKPSPPKKCPVSPNRLATLESLSYEIMTSTLPINKMKRILPEEQLPVNEKWPILSNFRKQTVLPSVKLGKQRLSHDMGELHTKINDYFQCDNFPLWQYKYVPKEQPRKYRLLKAIETEGIHLPSLPKH